MSLEDAKQTVNDDALFAPTRIDGTARTFEDIYGATTIDDLFKNAENTHPTEIGPLLNKAIYVMNTHFDKRVDELRDLFESFKDDVIDQLGKMEAEIIDIKKVRTVSDLLD